MRLGAVRGRRAMEEAQGWKESNGMSSVRRRRRKRKRKRRISWLR